MTLKRIATFLVFMLMLNATNLVYCQTMDEVWDSATSAKQNPNLKWFREAKFGLFIHWGLYSQLAGTWKDKNYYGSGEWIMNQAKYR